ncbi:MAG: hypothetical protein A3F10_07280 [Coxiella sp. RIFCSPHIGHO2_12_FULL_42_15]|nr:MAG: hypothetical protein A3F10_07280 [Coxiella sp. RIFCSPHIGHO2_12_FULL_42_15]
MQPKKRDGKKTRGSASLNGQGTIEAPLLAVAPPLPLLEEVLTPNLNPFVAEYNKFSERLLEAYRRYSQDGAIVKAHDTVFQTLISISGSLGASGAKFGEGRKIILTQEILKAIKWLDAERKGYLYDNDSSAIRELIQVIAQEFKLDIALQDIGVWGRAWGTNQYKTAIAIIEKKIAEISTQKIESERTFFDPTLINFEIVFDVLKTQMQKIPGAPGREPIAFSETVLPSAPLLSEPVSLPVTAPVNLPELPAPASEPAAIIEMSGDDSAAHLKKGCPSSSASCLFSAHNNKAESRRKRVSSVPAAALPPKGAGEEAQPPNCVVC